MNKPKKPTWKQSALAGAVLVHPVVGAMVFVFGAVVGCEPYMPDGAARAYGIEGGSNGLEILFIFYLFSLGVAPLILSAIGAVIVALLDSYRNS